MSNYGYTPPVGFGGGTATDPNAVKKKPGDPDYVDTGITGNVGAGGQYDMPGLAPVGTYTQQYDSSQGTGIDLSQPVQIAPGSRSAELMADAGYQSLLASLGLDAQTAQARTQFGQTAAQNKLTAGLSDLQRQSQEDRYGIDATLRSRGVSGESSQRQALQARSFENQGRQEQNLRGMSADEIAGLNNQLADTLAQLKRAEATGAGEAAGRLQTQRDAILARLQQQQSMDQQAAASKAQSDQVAAALAQMSQQANAADQPVAQAGAGGGQSFADWYNSLSPADRAAWDIYSGGGGGQQAAAAAPPPQLGPAPAPRAPARAPAPAPAAPYRQALPAIKAPPPRQDALYGPR